MRSEVIHQFGKNIFKIYIYICFHILFTETHKTQESMQQQQQGMMSFRGGRGGGNGNFRGGQRGARRAEMISGASTLERNAPQQEFSTSSSSFKNPNIQSYDRTFVGRNGSENAFEQQQQQYPQVFKLRKNAFDFCLDDI